MAGDQIIIKLVPPENVQEVVKIISEENKIDQTILEEHKVDQTIPEQKEVSYVTQINEIKGFTSDYFYLKLYESLLGSLICYGKTYWILQKNWKESTYRASVKHMRDKFEKYLYTLKLTVGISIAEKKLISEIISFWRKGNMLEDENFNNVIQKLTVDKEYLASLNINIIEEQKTLTKMLKPYNDIVVNFFEECCTNTNNEMDIIYTSDLHNLFVKWCLKNSQNYCDIRIFGRLLRHNNIKSVKMTSGNVNTCIKVNSQI